jgi:hypothetical protein
MLHKVAVHYKDFRVVNDTVCIIVLSLLSKILNQGSSNTAWSF